MACTLGLHTSDRMVLLGLAERMLSDGKVAGAVLAAVHGVPELREQLLSPGAVLSQALKPPPPPTPVIALSAAIPHIAEQDSASVAAGPSPFQPPPGLEHLGPARTSATAAPQVQLPPGLFEEGSDQHSSQEEGAGRPEHFDRPEQQDRPEQTDHLEQQRHEQNQARRCTLVVSYFPRFATEACLFEAFDAHLQPKGCVRRGRIVRNGEDHGCYAFLEFSDESAKEAALSLCERGRVTMDDDVAHTWRLRASNSKRATVAPERVGPKKTHRGRRSNNTRQDRVDRAKQGGC